MLNLMCYPHLISHPHFPLYTYPLPISFLSFSLLPLLLTFIGYMVVLLLVCPVWLRRLICLFPHPLFVRLILVCLPLVCPRVRLY